MQIVYLIDLQWWQLVNNFMNKVRYNFLQLKYCFLNNQYNRYTSLCSVIHATKIPSAWRIQALTCKKWNTIKWITLQKKVKWTISRKKNVIHLNKPVLNFFSKSSSSMLPGNPGGPWFRRSRRKSEREKNQQLSEFRLV